jgi:hypothetical protein
VLVVATLLASPAHGTLIVADPDDYAAGTDLRTAFTGITLSVEGNSTAVVRSLDGTFQDGPSAGTNVASTGTSVFGHDVTGSSINQDDFYRNWEIGIAGTTPSVLFRVDFDYLTDFVSVDMIADDDDAFMLWAYGTDGTLLDTFSSGSFAMTSMTGSISRSLSDISYVLVGGIAGEGGALDNLQYNYCRPFPGGGVTDGCKPPPNPVPEPGSLGLLAGGLIALRLMRRRASARPSDQRTDSGLRTWRALRSFFEQPPPASRATLGGRRQAT